MRNHPIRTVAAGFFVMFLLVFSASAQSAQTLSNNSGDASAPWQITGESTLVMNGFDLRPLNLTFPVTVTAVSINVVRTAPGATSTAVVYVDPNGGSPQDAQLVGQQQVNIETTGVVRIPLSPALTVNSPIVWVGFYLPVGFEFNADQSGASVLTYWAWTPGSTFDLANLGSAAVFGPSDGSTPVNLNIGGVARISAEINGEPGTAAQPTTPTEIQPITSFDPNNPPLGVQIVAQVQADLSILQTYPFCGDLLFYDPEDISVSARGAFVLNCRSEPGPFSPGVIDNIDATPGSVRGYTRRGILYEISASGEYQADPRLSEKLSVPVTHCLRPDQADLNTAVIAIAYGAPRTWRILPTVRYGELVCAEMDYIGYISLFVPRPDSEPTLDANLSFSGRPRPVDGVPFVCGDRVPLRISVHNEGFDPTPFTTIRVQAVHNRTGTIASTKDIVLGTVPPGGTLTIEEIDFFAPLIYINETFTLVFQIDPANVVAERNENDNTFRGEYTVLRGAKCR